MVGKPEGKRPLGRPRRGWEDNIRMEIVWEGMDWISDSGNGLVNTVLYLRVP
jgi:hypothetical protein